MNQRDQQILKIALPAIVTNITVPLLGLVDTAIVGHMGDASYIGVQANQKAESLAGCLQRQL